MCGIVGAIAKRPVAQILLEGLRRLEYRGYDSAGMAMLSEDGTAIDCLRATGKVLKLAEALQAQPLSGHTGIAHTRWATHGEPTETNAHPHLSDDEFAIVHNGIIENHDELRDLLLQRGYEFFSDTDTEVIVHLLHHEYQQCQDVLKALQVTVKQLHGAYGVALISLHDPEHVYVVRSGSPLVIGLGEQENFLASDPLALLAVTQRFIYLEEGDVAQISTESVTLFNQAGEKIEREIHQSELTADSSSKGEYRHYMLKEMYEQPQVAIDAFDGRYVNHQLVEQAFGHEAPELFKQVQRVHIVACGTSYHAGLVARYWIEDIAKLPCQVEVASENRYRNAVVEPNTLFVALSQSGETADTLAALRKAKESGYAATLAICNVSASSLVRESDMAFMIRAGREIGVAATKSFTAQLIALLMLTDALSTHKDPEIARQLESLPQHINSALALDEPIKQLSQLFLEKRDALFLGRGVEFPIALEGALKLKEISYIHAEAYPAGELKHGPLALVDKDMPIIVVAPNDDLAAKLESNIQEVQARGGEIIVFADEDLQWRKQGNTELLTLPAVPNFIAPIVYNIALQLLSYHVAVIKGTDVDQPRNLAKSVTVE